MVSDKLFISHLRTNIGLKRDQNLIYHVCKETETRILERAKPAELHRSFFAYRVEHF